MTTREIVRREYTRDPTQTLQVIGDIAGVTRERVRQIKNELGLETDYDNRITVCLSCHIPIKKKDRLRNGASEVCPPCYTRLRDWGRLYPVFCDWCGKIKMVGRAQIQLRNVEHPYTARRKAAGLPYFKGRYFCNRTCNGKYLGTFHGWQSKVEPLVNRA